MHLVRPVRQPSDTCGSDECGNGHPSGWPRKIDLSAPALQFPTIHRQQAKTGQSVTRRCRQLEDPDLVCAPLGDCKYHSPGEDTYEAEANECTGKRRFRSV